MTTSRDTGPVCPADVPETVRLEFDRLTSTLRGRATAEDSGLLLLLATAWATWRQAQADVAAQGTVVMSGGTAIQHPALAVADRAQSQIVSLSRELGLTPASRGKRRPARLSYAAPMDDPL